MDGRCARCGAVIADERRRKFCTLRCCNKAARSAWKLRQNEKRPAAVEPTKEAVS